MTTNSDNLAIALDHHQQGRLQAAEELYRQILQSDPRHADALHFLGVIAHQVGRHDVAIELMSLSIEQESRSPHVHNNLGGAYRASGKLIEAERCFRHTLDLDSSLVDAHLNLANVLCELGRWSESIEYYHHALALKPRFAAAFAGIAIAFQHLGHWDESILAYQDYLAIVPNDDRTRTNFANLLKQRGRLDDAIRCYREILARQPDFPAALVNLGAALLEQGHYPDAARVLEEAIRIDPAIPESHNNLGLVLDRSGALEQAREKFLRALELNPDYVDAQINLGNLLAQTGQLDDAICWLHRAIELAPRSAKAHNNLGAAYKTSGQIDQAVACFRSAIEFDPFDAGAHSNLSATLRILGHLDEAEIHARRSIEIDSNMAEAFNHLGNALKDQGKLDEAIDCYRKAVELQPDYANAHSNLIYTRIFCPGYDNARIFEDHRLWNEKHALPLAVANQTYANSFRTGRPLRIGYVSPDFRNHVIGRSLLPLFQEQDRQEFDIYCYADVTQPDDLTSRFQSLAGFWRPIQGLSDERVSQMIRDDQIDILVDLTLHLAQNRLLVFARKPAPVQVTFAGYPGTTGLTTIDYRFTDPYLDPPGSDDRYYSEKSFRLLDSFWCFEPLDHDTSVSGLPADRNRYVTFGCLNNFCKLNSPALKLWGRILNAVAGSRLIVLSGEGSHRVGTLRQLEDEGVSPDRVEFVPYQPRSQYLRHYHSIDIGLDTFPYNGHMTSLDAFWMGVPVVTLAGSTVAGRAGLCQLMNLGLPDLVAHSAEDYVAIAKSLAEDLPRLATLRAGLRQRMRESPLMDHPRFARGIESAYRQMWKTWCESKSHGFDS